MRKKGDVFQMAGQRDKDLFEAYRREVKRQLSLYGRITVTGLMQKVVESPASRYWVSPERACVVMRKLERGEPIAYMKPNKQRMYTALYREYAAYRREHPGTPMKHAVEIVVERPAPCFAVTWRVAGNIVRRLKGEER